MCIKTIVGGLIVLTPFIPFFIYIAKSESIWVAIGLFGMTAFVTAFFSLGLYLLLGGI